MENGKKGLTATITFSPYLLQMVCYVIGGILFIYFKNEVINIMAKYLLSDNGKITADGFRFASTLWIFVSIAFFVEVPYQIIKYLLVKKATELTISESNLTIRCGVFGNKTHNIDLKVNKSLLLNYKSVQETQISGKSKKCVVLVTLDDAKKVRVHNVSITPEFKDALEKGLK